jgi:hypothetical protein
VTSLEQWKSPRKYTWSCGRKEENDNVSKRHFKRVETLQAVELFYYAEDILISFSIDPP